MRHRASAAQARSSSPGRARILCLVDVNAAGLQDTAGLLEASGVDVLVHATDLAEPDNCRAAVEAAVARFGRLDALCNIAGIIFLANSHQMPAEQWHKTMAINLSAPFFLSRAAIPHLLQANGAIVNVASSAAFIGEAYAAAYCATKAGLVNLTKAHGHGVHEAADPDQCGGAGRNDHQHRRQLQAA